MQLPDPHPVPLPTGEGDAVALAFTYPLSRRERAGVRGLPRLEAADQNGLFFAAAFFAGFFSAGPSFGFESGP